MLRWQQENQEIQNAQPAGLDGDDEKNQEGGFRIQGGESQKQGGVQGIGRDRDVQQESGKVQEQDAGQVIQVESKSAPGIFQRLSQLNVENDGDDHPQIAVGLQAQGDEGNQPPHLAMQNGVPVKAEQPVQGIAGVDHGKNVSDDIETNDPEHQIGNSFFLIAVAEAFKFSAQIFQRASLLCNS